MNLQQPKALVNEYEQTLRELRNLREAKEAKAVWFAVAQAHDVDLPLPEEYMAKMLQERIWSVEATAKQLAAQIGVVFDGEA